MKTLFLDTNVLMQCVKLEQLPWQEMSKDQDISLLISRPVQEEIDRMKSDGNSRRAKRARAATTLIRSIILSKTSEVLIRDSAPRVTVRLAPPIALKSPFPFLDLSKTDDRIIIEGICYSEQHPEEDVALLTHDTQPMGTSKHCGFAFIAVPDEWLLPPEPDDRDKRITELEDKLRKFERSQPAIEIAFSDSNDESLKVATFTVMCYPALSSAEIEKLARIVMDRFPMATEFGQSAPMNSALKYASIDPFNLAGIQRRYKPASEEEIRKYAEESYPEWVENVKDFFKPLPSRLEAPTRDYRFSVSISNSGYSPAENVLVQFNLSGDLFLMPIDDKEKPSEANPLEIPKPPKPPTGQWVRSMTPFESMAEMTRALSIQTASPLDRFLPDLKHYQQPKHDKNAFYWKPHRPTKPMKEWVFECDEFRHKTEQEDFVISIRVPANYRPGNALFECRVSARNLHDPVISSLPVRVSYEDQDSFAAAQRYV